VSDRWRRLRCEDGVGTQLTPTTVPFRFMPAAGANVVEHNRVIGDYAPRYVDVGVEAGTALSAGRHPAHALAAFGTWTTRRWVQCTA
jgi:hypothetical protein